MNGGAGIVTEEVPQVVRVEVFPGQPTAGNYRVGERLKAVVFTEDGSRCLAYCALDGRMPFSETEANARRFAAVPRMVEVIQDAIEYCPVCGPDEDGRRLGMTDGTRFCFPCRERIEVLEAAGVTI